MFFRYFLYCSYKGANYHGWQVQPNGISVQETLTNALRTILRYDELEITGAGRTDAGVHAEMMTAHFDVPQPITDSCQLVEKLNALLPKDIAVIKILPVQPDAHARFDAVSRRYEYRVTTRKDVFQTELLVKVNKTLDFDKMNEAAQCLMSFRDFTSFSKLHTDVKTNNCMISHAVWKPQNDSEWTFSIEADRFLRNMVRAIVGTLFEVGCGKISMDEFKQIIEAKDRGQAGSSAPAQGLYLMEVKYPEAIFCA
jgi:tRNA pseudouridine38-40 synthase